MTPRRIALIVIGVVFAAALWWDYSRPNQPTGPGTRADSGSAAP